LRARIRRRQRIRRLTIVVTIAVISVSLIVAFYFVLNNSSPYHSFVGKTVSPSDLAKLTGVSDSTLVSIGRPSNVLAPNTISGTPLTSGGKPMVLYIGGDYCPYCAAERWSLIIALSRFGTFSNLTYTLSSSTDVLPNTPTFSFQFANYASSYVAFVGVEEFGQDPSVVRQPLTTQQQSLLSQYDTCPTSKSSGGIPFVDIANSYAINCGAQSNIDISGANWTSILNQLDTPTSNTARLIDGAANTIITAICNVDGHKPSSVCSQSFATLPLSFTQGASVGSQTALLVAPALRMGPDRPR
jgi:hypothetical protein